MGRKQAREGTMKLIYQMEINEEFSEEALSIFFENFPFDESEKDYIRDAFTKIRDNIETIDTHIQNSLEGWHINRLAKIDLAILRIALYEILYRDDIPVEVSINEAIETAKKYSSGHAGGDGVLHPLGRGLQPGGGPPAGLLDAQGRGLLGLGGVGGEPFRLLPSHLLQAAQGLFGFLLGLSTLQRD